MLKSEELSAEFFFTSRRRHTRYWRDWSSDVCSSDLAVDKDPGTTWTTESYSGATLAGKAGVGLYVDAAPGVAATSIEIDTPKPGWQAEIHVARDGAAPNGAPGEGEWEEVGGGKVKRKRQRFTLRTAGKQYRYYLDRKSHV